MSKLLTQSILLHLGSLLILAAFSLWGLQALFHPGLFTAHDIWHQVARLYHYSAALHDGQLLPLWVSTLANGYGYPLFIFSYHVPWIFVAPFVGMGLFSVEIALKTAFALGFVCSGLSMYAAAWSLTRRHEAALGAAVLYLIAPYHFLTLFVSASIGSVWAFVWVPLVFLGGVWILNVQHWKKGVVLFAIALAGLLFSHLLTAAMVLPILAIMWLFHMPQSSMKQIGATGLRLLIALFLTLLLSAWYIVPLLYYVPAIRAQENGSGLFGLYHSNFPTAKQLLYSPWGYGPITERASDGEISLQVGLAQWAAVGLSVVVLLLFFKQRKKVSLLLSAIIGLALSLFLMLQVSEPLWKWGNQFISLDYPFRLLLMAVFCVSLLFAGALALIPSRLFASSIVVVVSVLALYANRNHIRVNLYTDVPLHIYVSAEVTTNTFHEYLPRYAEGRMMEIVSPGIQAPIFNKRQLEERGLSTSPVEIPAQVVSKQQNTRELLLEVEATEATTISLRQFAFPDNVLFVNGQPQAYEIDSKGLIMLDIFPGRTTLAVSFQPRWWVRAIRIISLGIWVFLGVVGAVYVIKSYRRHAGLQRRAHAG